MISVTFLVVAVFDCPFACLSADHAVLSQVQKLAEAAQEAGQAHMDSGRQAPNVLDVDGRSTQQDTIDPALGP